jgi:hypothetical protein
VVLTGAPHELQAVAEQNIKREEAITAIRLDAAVLPRFSLGVCAHLVSGSEHGWDFGIFSSRPNPWRHLVQSRPLDSDSR